MSNQRTWLWLRRKSGRRRAINIDHIGYVDVASLDPLRADLHVDGEIVVLDSDESQQVLDYFSGRIMGAPTAEGWSNYDPLKDIENEVAQQKENLPVKAKDLNSLSYSTQRQSRPTSGATGTE